MLCSRLGFLRQRTLITGCAIATLTATSISVRAAFFGLTTRSPTSSKALLSSMTEQATVGTLCIAQFPCLKDNYGYLLHDPISGQTAAVDVPDADAYENELEQRGWKLTHILNTHHHWDHTGGNLKLKKDGVQVYGPATENIPGIDVGLHGGDTVEFGSSQLSVIDVGGHTSGHIAYHIESENAAFVGDALFSLGCGRMFEGTPDQFWKSLQRLRDLPDQTRVYCAHEYTASNLKFAQSVEPSNPDLQRQAAIIAEKRMKGEPTVPSLLGDEKLANPFLRCDFSEEIRRNTGITESDSDEIAFAKVRKAKDRF